MLTSMFPSASLRSSSQSLVGYWVLFPGKTVPSGLFLVPVAHVFAVEERLS